MSIAETSDDNFQKDVVEAGGLVFVDFYAPWCGPCKMIAPLMDEMSKEFPDVKFFKVNVDDNPHIAQTLGISGVPTLLLYKGGQQVDAKVGAMNREEMREFIKKHS